MIKKLSIIFSSFLLLLTLTACGETTIEIQSTVVADQTAMTNELKFIVESLRPTIDEPRIDQDFFGTSPLSAIISFYVSDESLHGTTLTVTVVGKNNDDLVTTFEVEQYNYIPVYGLYQNYDNTVKFNLGTNTYEHTITTEKLDTVTNVSITEANYNELSSDNFYFMTTSGAQESIAVDIYGEIRWITTLNLSFSLEVLENGHILVGTDRLIANPYHVTGLYEMNLLGKIYAEYRIPGGYHHDQYVMDNGDIIALSSSFDHHTEDLVVILDGETGEVKREIFIEDVLIDIYAGKMEDWSYDDWFHNNSVDYDASTESLLLSGRHQDIVINIDISEETPTLNYIIGDPDQFSDTDGFPVDKFLTPINSDGSSCDTTCDLEWQYAQHSAIFLPNNQVMILDNGNNRAKVEEDYIPASETYTRGVIYEIDATAGTIKQVYEYGSDRDDFYSPYISNVEYYADGHYLVHSGGIATLNGDYYNSPAPTSEYYNDMVLSSITVELLDDEVILEIKTNQHFYRNTKISTSTIENDFLFEEGKILGDNRVTDEFAGNVVVNNWFTRSLDLDITFTTEYDRLVINFALENTPYIILEGDTTHKYSLKNDITGTNALCTNQFDGSKSSYINFSGLSGSYRVYVVYQGIKYDSDYILKV